MGNKKENTFDSLTLKRSTATKNHQIDSVKMFFENRIEREWLSTNEAAQFLSISENALRIMVHREQIQAFKFGRRLRFKMADCRALFRVKGA